MSRLRSTSGMTLIEIVLVVSIFSAMTAIVSVVMVGAAQSFRRTEAETITDTNVRQWVARMVREIRLACYDPTESGTIGFLDHTATHIRFETAWDDDGDGVPDSVRELGYRLNGDTVEMWIDGNDSWRPLLDDVTTFELTYFRRNGEELAQIITDTNSIAFVGIEIAAQASRGIDAPTSGGSAVVAPQVIRQKASVEIRNETNCDA